MYVHSACTARAQRMRSTQYARGGCGCKSVRCTRSTRTAHAPVHARWARTSRGCSTQDGVIGDFLPLIATRGDSGRHALVRSADDFLDIATNYEREQQQAAADAPAAAPAKK